MKRERGNKRERKACKLRRKENGDESQRERERERERVRPV